MFTFLGRFHPLVVHLPIGICLLVGVLEFLASSSRLGPKIDPALAIILRLASASAIVAAALGLMLARGGGYPEHLITWHQRLTLTTVAAALACVATWSLYTKGRISRSVHRVAVTSMMAFLGVGAHFGGSLTHGAGYLVEYAPSFVRGWVERDAPSEKAAPPRQPEGDERVFANVLLPILERRCTGCHGAASAKGQLRLDTLDGLMNGGKSGPAVQSGDAKGSLLVRRMAIPISGEGHMPPESKPQPTADELELIGYWIDRGASSETKVRDLLVPDGARRLLADVAKGPMTSVAPPASAAPAISAAPAASTVPSASAATHPARPAPTPSVRPSPAVSVAHPKAPSVTFATVAPVLVRRCGKCHSGDDPAGGMSVRDRNALVSTSHVLPGRPNASPLFTRMMLALDDEDHMPPADVAQPSRTEIELIRSWISSGATAPAP